jgi:homoserine kinase type II
MAILEELHSDDFSHLCQTYGLGTYQNHAHVPHSSGNTIYVLSTSDTKYIVKVHERATREHLQFEVDLQNALSKHGLPVPHNYWPPQIVRGKQVLVSTFLTGDLVDAFSLAQLRSLSRVAANIACVLEKNMLHAPNRGECATQFDDWWDLSFLPKDIQQQAATLRENLLELQDLPQQIIHGDLNEYNVLVRGDAISAVLDFDNASRNVRAYELAVIIASCGASEEHWQPERIEAAITAFQQVFPLTLPELHSLVLLIERRLYSGLAWLYHIYDTHPERQQQFDQWMRWDMEKARNIDQVHAVVERICQRYEMHNKL